MPIYEIAGVVIDVKSNDSGLLGYLNNFTGIDKKKADLVFDYHIKDVIEIPQGTQISDDNIGLKWIKKDSGQEYCVYTQEFGIGKPMVLMDIGRDWQKAELSWCRYSGVNAQERINTQAQVTISSHIMMGIVFRYFLINIGGLVIHASAIKWKDKGVMISAPSGTGKSTYAKLWQEYIDDVKILNDDTPAVRVTDDQPYVFGTPWSGSSFLHCNDSAPLGAIVLLEQAQSNSLTRLSDQEAILKLMPRVFLPYFEQCLMHKALDVFEKIVRSVPIFLLQCRPEREAVELVYQCLK